MATGRIHNFAFFLLTFYFLKLINQFELIMQNKPNFRKSQMNVTAFYTVDYENDNTFRLPKNKANTNPIQTQYNANTNPIPEMSKMNVNSFITKEYRKNDAFTVQKNKANTNPIKPNL